MGRHLVNIATVACLVAFGVAAALYSWVLGFWWLIGMGVVN